MSNSPPSLRHVPGVLGRFAPCYLSHFVGAPFRHDKFRGLFAHPVRRHQIAVYDSVMDLLLKGYAELSGHRLRPETGTVAVMLSRIGFAFDDEYERREAAGEPLTFEEVFQSPAVLLRLEQWRELMRGHASYGTIRAFLYEFVTGLYQSYRDTTSETARTSFETLMRSAVIDSGGLLVTLAHVIARLHASVPTENVINQFSSLGVTAKLADDLIDLRADLAGGRPNLVQALALEHPAEQARIAAALWQGKRMHARWWAAQCPGVFQRITTTYEEHQAVLTSRWLRFASRLMWTPVLFGHGRAVETRGRL